MKKKILIFFILVSIIVIYTQAYATTLDRQRESVESDLESAQERVDDIDKEKGALMEEVNELSASIIKTEAEIDILKDKMNQLDASISEKEIDLADKQRLLDERLTAVYMNKGNTYLEAFFNGGLLNFVSNYDMIKQIAEYDNKLIDQIKQEKQDIQSEKLALENSKIQMTVKQKELGTKKDEKMAKVDALTEEQKKMQAIVDEKQAEINRAL